MLALTMYACTETPEQPSDPFEVIALSPEYRDFQSANSRVMTMTFDASYEEAWHGYVEARDAAGDPHTHVCDSVSFALSPYMVRLFDLQCARFQKLEAVKRTFPEYNDLSKEDRMTVALLAVRAFGSGGTAGTAYTHDIAAATFETDLSFCDGHPYCETLAARLFGSRLPQ